jgi:hypothetical protein
VATFDMERMLDDWQIAWFPAENKDTEMVLLEGLTNASVSLPKAVAEHDLDFVLSNPPRSHRRYTDLSWSMCYSHFRTELRYCLNSSPNLAARARSSGSI